MYPREASLTSRLNKKTNVIGRPWVRDYSAAAESSAQALASEAKLKAKEAERAALGASNVGVDDDTTDESPGGQSYRQYSTRDARVAAAAAEKAAEAALSPLTPPVGKGLVHLSTPPLLHSSTPPLLHSQLPTGSFDVLFARL